jgi:hypothetical protein
VPVCLPPSLSAESSRMRWPVMVRDYAL